MSGEALKQAALFVMVESCCGLYSNKDPEKVVLCCDSEVHPNYRKKKCDCDCYTFAKNIINVYQTTPK